jgi:hypothetical protein
MKLRSITLTGVEETTDLERLASMTQARQEVIGIEWGVLYSPDRAGQGGRYPSLNWIRGFSRFAFENRLNLALHVCGSGVDEMLASHGFALKLTSGFKRVQLNFNQSERKFNLDNIAHLVRGLQRPVITQHNLANESVSKLITAPNHQILVDASLGRGISPSSWPEPVMLKPTGYAGGLGPDNLAREILAIEAVTGLQTLKSWVDMESRLFRPEGTFDLDRAEKVLDIMVANVTRHGVTVEMPLEGVSP